jgi:hypothetical protein
MLEKDKKKEKPVDPKPAELKDATPKTQSAVPNPPKTESIKSF